MHYLVLKLDIPNTSYRLSKVTTKIATLRFVNLEGFCPSQHSNLNTSLERPYKELLNAYFSFENGQCKHKL